MKLVEMAAKKLCPSCGKSMAANHFWYKGGWRCKGAKQASASGQPLSVQDIESMVPELKKAQPNGMSWQVLERNGFAEVSWTFTFQRNSYTGAYKEHQKLIDAANQRIKQLADKYSDNVSKVEYFTAETAAANDDWITKQGEDPYYEHDQDMGGSITLKVT